MKVIKSCSLRCARVCPEPGRHWDLWMLVELDLAAKRLKAEPLRWAKVNRCAYPAESSTAASGALVSKSIK